MPAFLLKRLLVSLPTFLAILALVFVLVNAAPGDPVDAFVPPGQSLSLEQKEMLRHEMGLDRPLPVRFGLWLAQVARGDLGYRYKDGEPVYRTIMSRVPATLMLTFAGLGLGAVLGVALGLVAARRPHGKLDFALSLLAYLGISGPAFLLGILAMYVFALLLGWFPTAGYATPGDGSWQDVLHHLVLPASVLSIQFIAILMRYTRSSVLEVQSQDFMRTASAKGLSRTQALLSHAFPNALIPIVTVIGANFSALIGGAVFLETVFSWPGMGTLFIDGVETRDYPLIMGITLFMAVAILAVNVLTDVIYAWIDPRISLR
ncbi:ABC transporter permease [Acidovorax sp. JHL-9]|jgi:peptide/nickel transport system permease protein|uniref:ABC transporter permease n=1 Tax=Acidovorax sp. JHL-9 TaxID=1276756 RepID=UPI0003FF0566|nr:ABC transporter permease [Acidovorax sp. JHL-9]